MFAGTGFCDGERCGVIVVMTMSNIGANSFSWKTNIWSFRHLSQTKSCCSSLSSGDFHFISSVILRKVCSDLLQAVHPFPGLISQLLSSLSFPSSYAFSSRSPPFLARTYLGRSHYRRSHRHPHLLFHNHCNVKSLISRCLAPQNRTLSVLRMTLLLWRHRGPAASSQFLYADSSLPTLEVSTGSYLACQLPPQHLKGLRQHPGDPRIKGTNQCLDSVRKLRASTHKTAGIYHGRCAFFVRSIDVNIFARKPL